MSYELHKHGSKFDVINKETGDSEGESESQAAALAHLKTISAHEPPGYADGGLVPDEDIIKSFFSDGMQKELVKDRSPNAAASFMTIAHPTHPTSEPADLSLGMWPPKAKLILPHEKPYSIARSGEPGKGYADGGMVETSTDTAHVEPKKEEQSNAIMSFFDKLLSKSPIEKDKRDAQDINAISNMYKGGMVHDDPEIDRSIKGYFDGGPITPDPQEALPNWVQGQEQTVDQYGPAKQGPAVSNLMQAQNGMGNNLAKGAAGFADALMQGVSRAGNPGFLQGIEQNQQRQLENVQNIGKSLNEQNLQGMHEKERLEGMTSASPLGASESAAYIPLLQKVYPHLTPEQLKAIAANPSSMKAALGPGVEYGGKELEQKWKGAELGLGEKRLDEEARMHSADIENQQSQRGLEAARIGAETTNQQMERQQGQEKLKTEALGNLKKYGPLDRLLLHSDEAHQLREQAGLTGPSNTPPLTAVNKKTGQRIASTDGGRTWKPL